MPLASELSVVIWSITPIDDWLRLTEDILSIGSLTYSDPSFVLRKVGSAIENGTWICAIGSSPTHTPLTFGTVETVILVPLAATKRQY